MRSTLQSEVATLPPHNHSLVSAVVPRMRTFLSTHKLHAPIKLHGTDIWKTEVICGRLKSLFEMKKALYNVRSTTHSIKTKICPIIQTFSVYSVRRINQTCSRTQVTYPYTLMFFLGFNSWTLIPAAFRRHEDCVLEKCTAS